MKSVFTEEYDIFLQNLISARKEANLTQQDLADALSKPQSFVSKYERKERRLDVVEYVIISQAIGINPCSIIQKIEKRLASRDDSEGSK